MEGRLAHPGCFCVWKPLIWPREEKQKEQWSLGGKAGGRETDERGRGAKESVSAVRGSLHCSLVSDGHTEAGGGSGLDGLRNKNRPSATCHLTFLSLCFLFSHSNVIGMT